MSSPRAEGMLIARRSLAGPRRHGQHPRPLPRDSPTRGRYDAHTAALFAESDALSKTNGPNGVDKESVEYEREVLARHREVEARKGMQSTGGGGAGNILPSHTPSPHRSTSRSRAPPVGHSTGRGGANDAALEQLHEHERPGVHYRVDGVHSTGRGGRTNLAPALAPGPQDDLEGHHHHPEGQIHLESSGRGVRGNILRSRDPSREGRDGSRDREDKDKDAGAGAARAGSRERLGQMWNNLKHHGHGGHQHHEDHESIQEVAREN